MENIDIAHVFRDIADLLEIQGANPFRIRAYRNAAQTVTDHPGPIRKLVAEGADLTECLSTEELAFDGQASALIVGEADASLAVRLFEDLVLGSKVFDDVLLLPIDPTGEGDQEKLPGL